ncbi:tetratricopeptide repeat protein [bacterium]|nr:tetratricopeptide repeat protein [bacterium]
MKRERLVATLFAVGILFICGYAYSGTFTELYNQGNEAYRNGDYFEAIEYYQEAIQSGAVNEALFYNLGNAYFKANQIGNAILYYNRALLLAPRDEAVKNNLEYAKLMTFDKIDSIYDKHFLLKFYRKFLLFFNFKELYMFIFILSILITIVLIIVILGNRRALRRTFLRLLLIFCIIEFLVIAVFVLKSNDIWQNSAAVVMVSKLDVTSAPGSDSELLFTIHEGTRVAVDESRADWVKILLEDGRHGWVPAENISYIKTF